MRNPCAAKGKLQVQNILLAVIKFKTRNPFIKPYGISVHNLPNSQEMSTIWWKMKIISIH